jgi:spore coat protein A, manganese oxidase
MSWQDMSNKIARREILYLGAGLAAVSATPPLVSTGEARASATQRFQRPLPIPRVLKPVRTDSTTDYYEMTQREAEVEILPGLRTTSMPIYFVLSMRGCSFL